MNRYTLGLLAFVLVALGVLGFVVHADGAVVAFVGLLSACGLSLSHQLIPTGKSDANRSDKT